MSFTFWNHWQEQLNFFHDILIYEMHLCYLFIFFQVLMVRKFFWLLFQRSAALRQHVWSTYPHYNVNQFASRPSPLMKMRKVRWSSLNKLWTFSLWSALQQVVQLYFHWCCPVWQLWSRLVNGVTQSFWCFTKATVTNRRHQWYLSNK